MNKIHAVNLGGYPFNIDDDAFEYLNRYLGTIHNHFKESEGYEEITTDIEYRLAELFQEILGDRMIVTIRDIEESIQIMGRPEEFGAEPIERPAEQSNTDRKSYASERDAGATTDKGKQRIKTGKRLFRDTDDKVVGGVCSGLAAYFGIEDPIWVRLLFAGATVFMGFGAPLYFLLWIIAPEAKTSGDRLAMRGEKVTVSNIGKIVEEELDRFGDAMSDFGERVEESFGKKKRR